MEYVVSVALEQIPETPDPTVKPLGKKIARLAVVDIEDDSVAADLAYSLAAQLEAWRTHGKRW